MISAHHTKRQREDDPFVTKTLKLATFYDKDIQLPEAKRHELPDSFPNKYYPLSYGSSLVFPT